MRFLKGNLIFLLFCAFFALFAMSKIFWSWRSERFEKGYIEFNSKEYAEARKSLMPLAHLGDEFSQDLISYIEGLGLIGKVDSEKAIYWARRSSGKDDEEFLRNLHYIGKHAEDGAYDKKTVEIGKCWILFADEGGLN